MASITVKCANPEMMRLVVTAEMSVHDWHSILGRLETIPYYAPLHEFLSAIKRGLKGLEEREVVNGSPEHGT